MTVPARAGAGSAAASSPGPPARVIHHLEDVMGTKVIIDVYTTVGPDGADRAAARADRELTRQLAEAVAILHRADEMFSTWRPDSPVSRLRRGEITAAQAPPEMAEVLERCAAARDLSGGWFDPWAVPGGFDPSGYVKGWAAQHALAAFGATGICGVLVNAAGDIASTGGPGEGRPFRIGIPDPRSPLRLAEVVELPGSDGAAIATSGTYERGDHLIDPHSGQPAARAASASVTGPDLGLADALATAVAVAGEPGLALIAKLDGYEALIINPDGSKQSTKSFPIASAGAARLSRCRPGHADQAMQLLSEELAVLEATRGEVARCLAAGEQARQQLNSLDELAAQAGSRLGALSLSERREVLALLDVRMQMPDQSKNPALRITGTVGDLGLLPNTADDQRSVSA